MKLNNISQEIRDSLSFSIKMNGPKLDDVLNNRFSGTVYVHKKIDYITFSFNVGGNWEAINE
jgi:hypothetical protein